MKVAEIARRAGYSEFRIRQMIDAGEVPGGVSKPGKYVKRWAPDSQRLRRWMATAPNRKGKHDRSGTGLKVPAAKRLAPTQSANEAAGNRYTASQATRAGAVSIEVINLKWRQWWARDLQRYPVKRWSPEYRRRVQEMLQPIADFHASLATRQPTI